MQQIRVLPTLPSLLVSPGKPLIHRDISWLQFNERVLDEAREVSNNPLLERLKFLAITATNLDEFFMIRFAALSKKLKASTKLKSSDMIDGKRLQSIHDSILENVAKFGVKQIEVLDALHAELADAGIELVRNASGTPESFRLGKQLFESQIVPKLSPPETFELAKLGLLENLKMAAIFPEGLWFRVSRTLPLLYPARDDSGRLYFFFLDDLLLNFLGPTFGLKHQPALVRLTRDADFTADIGDADPASIPDVVKSGLGTREKGVPVRLQYTGEVMTNFLEHVSTSLRLSPGQMLPAPNTLCLQGLWSLYNFQAPELLSERAGLRYSTLAAQLPPEFESADRMFRSLRERDFLLHHPYDTFETYIEWIRKSAADPDVDMIEMTIYRADRTSALVELLKHAAKVKKVKVIIELRARFDEFNNLRLADDLRKEGVEVAFGFGKLKLHAKITLVTRRENGITRWYTHLSTGNYNATTARVYTDMAILTASPEIGADARHFFDAAFDGRVPNRFKRLVSAPTRMHQRLLNHIKAETEAARRGEKTRIVAKVNALVDEGVIDALYEASGAGVHVDLIVRGACSLVPGVGGLSDNIRVISVVDRFLEHSRIYYFESEGAMYLSSADWMPRNFFSRLEIAFPVLDQRIFSFIRDIVIPTYLSDNSKARELTPQGTWRRLANRKGKASIRSQMVFENLAQGRYQGTPLLHV